MERKRIREELIEMKNKLEVLIEQLGTETEVTLPAEESLENFIFNPRLFNTPEKLAKLKETLEDFFCDNSTKNLQKLNVGSKNQFFCLYAALWSRPGVLAKTRIADFVKQMVLWFPQWTADPKDVIAIQHLKDALYDEQQNWKLEDVLQNVTEWYKFINHGRMSKAKARHFGQLAMSIYTSVNQLVKNL
jgi:hypothetical protein